ncbi:uncharacterized protein [Euwallacea similis]|uniref:uncharacterized protein n=1 Tax=Euwallacea similis TaxID=1736056 RepID=UPI00344F8C21
MIKNEILVEEWRRFQWGKLKKRLKMNHPCRLELLNPILAIDANLKFVTQGEQKIVFSCINDQALQYIILLEEINGYTPNQREGTIQISYRDQMQAVLRFSISVYYTAALRELEHFLREEIGNLPTPPSSSDSNIETSSSGNSSNSSNEEV